MLENGYLADFPIVIAAIDPCFSCTDRTTIAVKDTDGKDKGIMDWKTLRSYGIKFYKQKGVDFSKIRII